MKFEEKLPLIRDISIAIRGKDFTFHDNRPYEVEINNLIESVGFDEFFKNSDLHLKIEFLASCSIENFERLIKYVNIDAFLKIIIYSDLSDIREILKKLLLINGKTSYSYWQFISSNVDSINGIDDTKKNLLKGYLEEFLKRNIENVIDGTAQDERLLKKIDTITAEYEQLKIQHADKVSALHAHIAELEERTKENIQDRIDKNLSAYVESSVLALTEIEKKLKCAAARWSMLSVFILFSGFTAGIGFALFGYLFGPDIKTLKWPELLIFSIKGLFLVSAFVAAAGYSFMKSNAFTHEAIIVSNRAHAIQFGKLYLEIYGNTVERSEMQKIFENWNISSDTAFLKHKNDKSESVKFSELLDSLKKVKDLIPVVGKD
ncbi:MAG: hypothetical protein RSB86_16620 [Comamonas sp.]|uniref:hypothetical protein n=1 Tax=Comamonas sp. TaxID=34028 RepID=UPI002FC80446